MHGQLHMVCCPGHATVYAIAPECLADGNECSRHMPQEHALKAWQVCLKGADGPTSSYLLFVTSNFVDLGSVDMVPATACSAVPSAALYYFPRISIFWDNSHRSQCCRVYAT